MPEPIDTNRLERRILLDLGQKADDKLDSWRTYWTGFVHGLAWSAKINQAQTSWLIATIDNYKRS